MHGLRLRATLEFSRIGAAAERKLLSRRDEQDERDHVSALDVGVRGMLAGTTGRLPPARGRLHESPIYFRLECSHCGAFPQPLETHREEVSTSAAESGTRYRRKRRHP